VLKRIVLTLFVFFCLVSPLKAEDYSDTSRFIQGFGKILSAPFYLPSEVLTKTFTQFPFGVVGGALTGTYRTTTTLMGGLWDMAGAAAPYAKYAFPFFL